MGYRAYSKVVFGLEVTDDDVTIKTKVRGCNHNTDLNAKFCSECGKPVYKIEEERIVDSGYEKDEIAYFQSTSEQNDGILGFLMVETEDQDCGYHALPEVDQKMKQELTKLLNENKINFKEEDLKPYLFTYHSY